MLSCLGLKVSWVCQQDAFPHFPSKPAADIHFSLDFWLCYQILDPYIWSGAFLLPLQRLIGDDVPVPWSENSFPLGLPISKFCKIKISFLMHCPSVINLSQCHLCLCNGSSGMSFLCLFILSICPFVGVWSLEAHSHGED